MASPGSGAAPTRPQPKKPMFLWRPPGTQVTTPPVQQPPPRLPQPAPQQMPAPRLPQPTRRQMPPQPQPQPQPAPQPQPQPRPAPQPQPQPQTPAVEPQTAPRPSPRQPQSPGAAAQSDGASSRQSDQVELPALNDLSMQATSSDGQRSVGASAAASPQRGPTASPRTPCARCEANEQKRIMEHSHLEQELQRARRQSGQDQQALSRLESTVEELRRSLTEAEERLAASNGRKGELERELLTKSEEVLSVQGELASLQERGELQRQGTEAELAEARQELERQTEIHQAALKESQDECERLQSELTAKQSQYQDTSKLLEDAKSVATFLRTQLDELLEDKKSLEEQLQKHQGEREAGEGTTSDEQQQQPEAASENEKDTQQKTPADEQVSPVHANGTAANTATMSQDRVLEQLLNCQVYLRGDLQPDHVQLQQLAEVIDSLQGPGTQQKAQTANGTRLQPRDNQDRHKEFDTRDRTMPTNRPDHYQRHARTVHQVGQPMHMYVEASRADWYGGRAPDHVHYGVMHARQVGPDDQYREVHAGFHDNTPPPRGPRQAWPSPDSPPWEYGPHDSPGHGMYASPTMGGDHMQQEASLPPYYHHPRIRSESGAFDGYPQGRHNVRMPGRRHASLQEEPSPWHNTHRGDRRLKQPSGDLFSHKVGDAVFVHTESNEEFTGTVRYVGSMENASPTDIFIGVELTTQIGGNLETVEGHTYFACKSGHGVLLRPDQVMKMERATPGDQEDIYS